MATKPAGNGGGSANARRRATLRVGIVDENEMFALGLRACLQDQPLIEVTTEPDDRTDVAVASPKAASERSFACPVVVCGELPGRVPRGNLVLAVLPRGTLTPDQLLAAIHAAAAGLRVSPPEPPPSARLEGRRLEVLRLLAAGADTREIAQRLGYSDRTIKSVIHEIQLALGARNRTQAVAEGVRQGLIGLVAEH